MQNFRSSCKLEGTSVGMAQKPVNTAMLGDNFQFSLGPPDSGFSIFLADRTKKIHFIRHAEGHHNVMTATSGNNDCLTVDHAGECPADHALWDARLTEVGVAQAKSLRDHLSTRPSGGRSFTSFDLVVVSPLTRTCETALHGAPTRPQTPRRTDLPLTRSALASHSLRPWAEAGLPRLPRCGPHPAHVA